MCNVWLQPLALGPLVVGRAMSNFVVRLCAPWSDLDPCLLTIWSRFQCFGSMWCACSSTLEWSGCFSGPGVAFVVDVVRPGVACFDWTCCLPLLKVVMEFSSNSPAAFGLDFVPLGFGVWHFFVRVDSTAF